MKLLGFWVEFCDIPAPLVTSHWHCHGTEAMAIMLIDFIDEVSRRILKVTLCFPSSSVVLLQNHWFGFVVADLDGNGVWDADEVKALFLKELDKMYTPGASEDDMRERIEELERMREHVFKEADVNRDGLIR
jgi:hypothetical protein